MAIKRNTIITAAEKIKQYLYDNSLARNIIKPENLNGSIPNYGVDDDMTLDDISIMVSGYRGKEVVSGTHIAAHGSGRDFWLPTWEFEIRYKNSTLQKDIDHNMLEKIIDNNMLEKMKLDFLKKEEDIFIDFVKQVMSKNNRYIICTTIGEAIKKIKKIKYKKIWAGKEMKVDLLNIQDIRSPNLNGFILTHQDDSDEVGIFVIRQEPTIFPFDKCNEIVIFEEQAMMIINKELTYIEVKNE